MFANHRFGIFLSTAAVAVLFSLGSAGAQTAEDGFMVFNQPQPPDVPNFSVRLSNIAADDTSGSRLIIELGFINDALQFIKDKKKGFSADYKIELTLSDSTGKEAIKKRWDGSVYTDSYKKTYSKKIFTSVLHQLDFQPGQYNFKVDLTDSETGRSGTQAGEIRLRDFNNGEFRLGGILFLKRLGFAKNVTILGAPTDLTGDKIYAYFELYNLPEGDSTTVTFDVKGSDDASLAGGSDVLNGAPGVVRGAVPLADSLMKLPNFEVVISAAYKDKLLEHAQFFRMVPPDPGRDYDIYANLDESIDKMIYLLSKKKVKKLKEMPEPQRTEAFDAFWAKRDRSPNTPENEFMMEYYRRVAIATEKFKEHEVGWRTDRGMIFVKLGAPQYVDEPFRDGFIDPTGQSRDIQVWHYTDYRRRVIFERIGREYRIANYNEIFDLLNDEMRM